MQWRPSQEFNDKSCYFYQSIFSSLNKIYRSENLAALSFSPMTICQFLNMKFSMFDIFRIFRNSMRKLVAALKMQVRSAV